MCKTNKDYRIQEIQGKQYRSGFLMANEEAEYSEMKLSSGVGQLCQAGVRVTKGASGTLKIKMQFTTFSSEAYQTCTKNLTQVLQSEKIQKLQECESKKDYKGWWFWLFSGNESEYEHNKDMEEFTTEVNNAHISEAIQQMYSEKKETYEVEGEFYVEGQSMIPTTVNMFIESLNVETSFGNSISVIDSQSNPIALDTNTMKQPDTATVKETKPFKIQPISN